MTATAREPIARTLLALPLAPLRRLERTRGLRRWAWIALYLALAAPIGLVIYRYGALWALPDVGDPFDVEAFRAARVPETDARPLYERASARFVLTDVFRGDSIWRVPEALRGGWSKASPRVKHWVAVNREALELWRQAADRPEADPPHEIRDPEPRLWMQHFAWLAQLEASRFADEGRMADAWTLIRANLRAVRQTGTIEPLAGRYGMLNYQREYLNKQVAAWAADPRTDAGLLRRALADVQALDAIPDRDLDGFKAAYLRTIRQLERGEPRPFRGDPPAGWLNQAADLAARSYLEIVRFARREPERSRRVARLVFANWLSHVGDPIGTSYHRRFDVPGKSLMLYVDLERPDAPAAPGLPSPKEIVAWYATTTDLDRVLPPNLELYYKAALPLRAAGQADLVLTLASALYAREHGGKQPPSPGALVGPYLKTLPAGYVPPAPIPGP